LECFWKTIKREWNKIDRHRIDKYYAFLNYQISESFTLLKNNNWSDEAVDKYTNLIRDVILDPEDSSIPKGVIFHLCDSYIEELMKVQKEEIKFFHEILPELF